MRFLWLLLLLPVASACTEDDPCLISVHIDPDEGLYYGAPGDTRHAANQWDWVVFSVQNHDTRDHELFLQHYGLAMEAPGAGGEPSPMGIPGRSEHGPLRLSDSGNFTLEDQTTRNTLDLEVLPGQRPTTTTTTSATSSAPETETSTESGPRTKEIPGAPLGWLGLALLATVRRLSGAP